MSATITANESIMDRNGNVVTADAAALLRAIDRLMTVGTYYSLQHEQYRIASETACAAIVAAIRPRRSLAIEIAATGLVIDGQTIDPHHRVVRQIHDLLVSLNLAHIEIFEHLTAADLRRSLALLQEGRLALGQAQSFREITIEGLPASVNVASRRVGSHGDDDDNSLDDLLSAWGGDPGKTGTGAGRDGHAEFILEFMDLLKEAMEKAGAAPRAAVATSAVALSTGAERRADATNHDLQAIRQGLQRLLEGNPDASELTGLLDLARQTVRASGDPARADLVFDMLRGKLGVTRAPAPPPIGVEARPEQYECSVAELERRLIDLAARPDVVPEPRRTSRWDQLAIAFRLLSADPAPRVLEGSLEILRRICSAPDLDLDGARVISASLASLAASGQREVVDRAAPLVLATVREAHPARIADIWAELDGKLDPDAIDVLWPHLVNDLLLGLEPATGLRVTSLCLLAGQLAVENALEHVPRLASLPAVGSGAQAGHVFLVPPARMCGVHAAVLQTVAADWYGPRLHRALARRPLDALTGVLMNAIEDYRPEYRHLLLALLRESGSDSPSVQLSRLASAVLVGVLADLPPSQRDDAWIPEAISWLGRLDRTTARPLLRRIMTERRWLLRKAWPDGCRAAAALAAGIGEN